MQKNYRKIYEKSLNINIPKGYVIHHIDMNRDNNKLENLVMLPSRLHKQYHESAARIIQLQEEKLLNTTIMTNGFASNDWLLWELKRFQKIYTECCKWLDYKKYLLGEIPNIHGIHCVEVEYGSKKNV